MIQKQWAHLRPSTGLGETLGNIESTGPEEYWCPLGGTFEIWGGIFHSLQRGGRCWGEASSAGIQGRGQECKTCAVWEVFLPGPAVLPEWLLNVLYGIHAGEKLAYNDAGPECNCILWHKTYYVLKYGFNIYCIFQEGKFLVNRRKIVLCSSPSLVHHFRKSCHWWNVLHAAGVSKAAHLAESCLHQDLVPRENLQVLPYTIFQYRQANHFHNKINLLYYKLIFLYPSFRAILIHNYLFN